MDETAKGALAEFRIDSHKYSIFVEYPPARSGSGKTIPGEQEGTEIVGQLTIRDRRYVVVHNDDPSISKDNGRIVDILTKRELQIVMLVAQGMANKQVADRLHISEWTVSTHLRRIFAKLGVDSRAAMIYRCTKFVDGFRADG